MMSADVEELLTRELRRRAAAASWRPELLQDALREHHKWLARRRVRLRRLRGLAAVVAAGVLAALSVVAARQGAPQSPIETVAVVLSRAGSAVGSVSGDVLEAHSRLSNGWSYVTWVDQTTGQYRVDVSSPAGPVDDVYGGGSQPETIVSYQGSWWLTLPVPAGGRQPVDVGPAELPSSAAAWGGLATALPTPAGIRRDLASGRFRLLGTQTVDGRRLLHLDGSIELSATTIPHPLGSARVTIWLNLRTYLPVRTVLTENSAVFPLESRFSWLPITPATTAVFTPHIPAGFTRGPTVRRSTD